MVAGAQAVHGVLQRRQQQLLWAQVLQGLELGAQVRQAVRELGCFALGILLITYSSDAGLITFFQCKTRDRQASSVQV